MKNSNDTRMFREYPDVVTVEDVQAMLGIGRQQAYELVRSGQIYSAHMGKKYLIPKIGVIDYLCSAQMTCTGTESELTYNTI